MDTIKQYFSIRQEDNGVLIINDRIPLDWKEIGLFSMSLISVLVFAINILTGIIIGVVVSILYVLFRFTAWIFYKEIIINISSKTLLVKKYRLGKLMDENLLDKDLNVGNFEFKGVPRSGTIKYVFSYKTHKTYDLLILKSKNDKEKLNLYLKQGSTTQTTD